MLTGLLPDVRRAVRSLARSPGFTIATVTSLALGFALAACALAVANAYLARSFPYPNTGRLHHVMYAPPGPVEPRGMSGIDWQAASDVVEHALTTSGQTYYLAADDGARSARGLQVSRAFMQALAVRAALGRAFVAEDFEEGRERVAMIGHELWRDHFGRDPSVIGRTLRLEVEGSSRGPELVHVVGVLPPRFWFGRNSTDSIGIMVPLRTRVTTYMVALREGVSVEQAQRRLTSVAAAAATWIPPDWPGVRLESMHSRYVETLGPMLRAIAVAAALVIALTCVSVAVLVLLRTMRRSRDVAIRVAHGAARRHLLRLFSLETALLSLSAIALGAVLAMVALRFLTPSIERQLGKPSIAGPAAMSIDAGVALVVAALVAVVSLSLGLIPALVPWQRRLAATLRGDVRVGADNVWTRRVRAWLIGVEIAGSVALLVGCGLMIRTAASFQATDLGTDFRSVVRARIVLRGSSYPDAAAFERFHIALREQLASRGLTAAVSGWPPFIDYPMHTIEAEAGGATLETTRAGMVAMSPGYFSIAEIPIRKGRDFATTDGSTAEPVAIVSETLARELWPAGTAIGSRIRYVESRPAGAPEIPWRRVVGVVADARQTYEDQVFADLYVPTLQADPGRFISLLIKTADPPVAVTSALRTAVATLDPTAVTTEARPVMAEDTELARVRFMRGLLALFAGLTVLLSALGIYGVVAHSVRQREREVAIRVAIGATPQAIATLFLRESAWLIGAAIVAGSVAAIGLARVLENRFFSTASLDAVTVIWGAALMALVGLMATLEPVMRAARRSPVETLHSP